MWWFPLTLATAVAESFKDLLAKRAHGRLDPWLTAWGLMVFTLPFLLPLLWILPPPRFGPQFWPAVVSGALCNTVAFFLYIHAVRRSDLSLTTPILAFSPVLLLLTSPIMVGESPSPGGLVGILLVVGGSYILNLGPRGGGPWAPFLAMLTLPGPRLMLGVAAIWGVTANLDKIAVVNSSPLHYAFALFALMALFMAPPALYMARGHLRQVPANLGLLLLLGGLNAFAILCQMVAVQQTLVVYVIAVKRTGGVLGVVWGWLFLKEPDIVNRLLGAAIMAAGVALIALA
ncbi:MAG: EamA family transporter [Magnetococcales bacterium]|nr:EamA family transporter [Magnetococcales bacterium]